MPVCEFPSAAANAVFLFQVVSLFFFCGQLWGGKVFLQTEVTARKAAATAQHIRNILFGDILAGRINGRAFPVLAFRSFLNDFLLLLRVRKPNCFALLRGQGQLLQFRLRGSGADGHQQLSLFNQGSDFIRNRIPCQVALRGFGQVVALPKFQILVMPDKSRHAFAYIQLGVDLFVAGSAKFTARSKVSVFFKIRKNVCVVGAGAGLLRQQAQNQAVIQRRQVGSGDRKRGGRLHALL